MSLLFTLLDWPSYFSLIKGRFLGNLRLKVLPPGFSWTQSFLYSKVGYMRGRPINRPVKYLLWDRSLIFNKESKRCCLASFYTFIIMTCPESSANLYFFLFLLVTYLVLNLSLYLNNKLLLIKIKSYVNIISKIQVVQLN